MTFPFTRDRYRHELLERDGDVCLVERTNQITDSVHWEVVVLQHRPAETLPNGDRVAARVAYPKPSQWGMAAWTFTDLTEARRRWAELASGGAKKGGSQAG